MIHINLLPPELRKRTGGVNPVALGFVAGSLVCVAMAVCLVNVLFRISSASALFDSKTTEVAEKEVQAKEVAKLEAEIADAKNHRDYLVTLLSQKMYWARTIDEFINVLNGPWSMPGYAVCCLELNIQPAGAPSGPGRKGTAEVAYAMTWRYKLLGENPALAGDYMSSFWKTLEGTRLWNEFGFIGKPDDSYKGYKLNWDANIERMIVESPVTWQRVKVVNMKKSSAGGE